MKHFIIDDINTVEDFQNYIEDINQYQSEYDSDETHTEWMNHLEEAIIRINANKDDLSENNFKFTTTTRLYRAVWYEDGEYSQSWTTKYEDALDFGDNIYYIDIEPNDEYICWWNAFDGGIYEVVIANVQNKYVPKRCE